jgi:hypothetical protein
MGATGSHPTTTTQAPVAPASKHRVPRRDSYMAAPTVIDAPFCV